VNSAILAVNLVYPKIKYPAIVSSPKIRRALPPTSRALQTIMTRAPRQSPISAPRLSVKNRATNAKDAVTSIIFERFHSHIPKEAKIATLMNAAAEFG
jgi:hypothetical protein